MIPTIEDILQGYKEGHYTFLQAINFLHEHLRLAKLTTQEDDLRDGFAATALHASLRHEKNLVCLGGGNLRAIASIADDAYVMAAAMLNARAK